MSDQFRKLIREIIEEELDLDEVSTSGDAGPYNIPGAFRGNSAAGKAKQKKNSEQAGYTLSGEKIDSADDNSTPDDRIVRFGENTLHESDDLQTKINHAQSMIQKTQNRIKYSRPGSKERDEAQKAKQHWKDVLAAAQEEKSKQPSSTNESLTENRYTDYRMSEGHPRKKIGTAIREINKQISEIDRVVKMNARLKKESGLQSEHLWKNTVKGLTALEGRLNVIAARIRELKS